MGAKVTSWQTKGALQIWGLKNHDLSQNDDWFDTRVQPDAGLFTKKDTANQRGYPLSVYSAERSLYPGG